MSKALFDARRKISQVNTSLRGHRIVNAVESLHSGLQNMLSEPLLKSERREFEKLLDDAVKSISSNKKFREDHHLLLTYQAGKERELLGDLRVLLDSLETLAVDEMEKKLQQQEAAKQARLMEGENALMAGDLEKADAIFCALANEFDQDVRRSFPVFAVFSVPNSHVELARSIFGGFFPALP